jgi:hypothetical protein
MTKLHEEQVKQLAKTIWAAYEQASKDVERVRKENSVQSSKR